MQVTNVIGYMAIQSTNGKASWHSNQPLRAQVTLQAANGKNPTALQSTSKKASKAQ